MPTPPNQYRPAHLTARKLLPTALASWSIAILAGSVAGLAAIKSGFHELTTAQLSMGATGLIAGWTYTRMARNAGAAPTARHTRLFSAILAIALISGVTPLFAAVGSTLKLTLLAFYSFSFAGAIAGLGLYFVFKTIFEDRVPGDPAALLVAGYFGFGLAAGAASAVDLLGAFFPRSLLVFVTFATIILICGLGSAGSMALYLAGRPDRTAASAIKVGTKDTDTGRLTRRTLLSIALICIAAPFYLNDLANIFISNWYPWLVIDYLFAKAYPIVILVCLIKTNRITRSEVGLTGQNPIPFTVVFLLGTLSVLFLLQNGQLITRAVTGYASLGRMPVITDPFWHRFDLFIGLFLVAIVEELVFRGLFCAVLERYTRNAAIIVFFSAIAFGLIHWSAGFTEVVKTTLAGSFYMALYLKTRSLPAIILSHFVVNLITFSRVIPAGLLTFM